MYFLIEMDKCHRYQSQKRADQYALNNILYMHENPPKTNKQTNKKKKQNQQNKVKEIRSKGCQVSFQPELTHAYIFQKKD